MPVEFHCASGAVCTGGTVFHHHKKGTVPYKGYAGKKKIVLNFFQNFPLRKQQPIAHREFLYQMRMAHGQFNLLFSNSL